MELGATAAASAYRVLARKYRPATFDDLIGQDAMVRTISNAFETNRVPQAWILTGVRGVGKTTTARILARALNYEMPDGSGAPTVHMPQLGVHCQAIMDSRHVDVIEMDAASHNGVDDIRQINEAVRYAPVSARYKVYILDEVHMVTSQGFNALLKTLEEPPPHVKFVFATTEIRKVPVTVLSRCQRFDLRRVEAGLIVKHLDQICAKESIAAEPEALAMIARAAEGSVRDSLSLLDQAIAHAAGGVRAEDVRQMLGLADRARVIDLFEAIMRGDVAAALKELRDQYESGADPAVTLADLAEFTNFVTRVKIVPSVADDPSLAEAERTRGRALAASLSMRVLSRTWQMLFRGIPEVQSATKPIAAAEMVLVRLAYAADLPTPDEVIRSLDTGVNGAPPRPQANGGGAPGANSAVTRHPQAEASRSPGGAPRAALAAQPAPLAHAAPRPSVPRSNAETAPAPLHVERFEDVIALAADKRELKLKAALERDVRLVKIENGRLEIALEPAAAPGLVNDLTRKLSEWTSRRWLVVVSGEPGAPTIREQSAAEQAAREQGVRGDPLVQALMNRFPGAEIVAVRVRAEPATAPGAPDGDDGYGEPTLDDGPSFGEHGAVNDVDDDF